MWPYPWTHVGTPSHLGHMDRVGATMPSQAHAGAAQEAPDIGQWEGRPLGKTFFLQCQTRHPELPKIPTYLPQDMASSGGVGGKSAGKPATNTHSPTIWIPEYAMGPDHTHIRSVDGGDTRCATLYGLQSGHQKMKGSVAPPGFRRMHQRGSDIQLVTGGTVEVGHPSAPFPTDSACGGVAIRSGLRSRHGRWSHLVSHGFSRGGSTTTTPPRERQREQNWVRETLLWEVGITQESE